MPNDEIVISTPGVTLFYHPRSKIIHHEIRQFTHGQPFRELLETGLGLIRKYHARKWLSDDRGNGPLTLADAEWATGDWAPRMLALGWNAWAVVLPEKALGQMNMKRWIETYAAQGVTALAFTDPLPAMTWLEAQ